MKSRLEYLRSELEELEKPSVLKKIILSKWFEVVLSLVLVLTMSWFLIFGLLLL